MAKLAENLIVLPGQASITAWRRLPGPLLLAFVTTGSTMQPGPGVAVAVAVGDGAIVAVAVAVGATVAVAVAVGAMVAVAVAVGATVAVAVAVGATVAVAVAVGATVAVAVAVGATAAVAVAVGATVAVAVAVGATVAVAVGVAAAVTVTVPDVPVRVPDPPPVKAIVKAVGVPSIETVVGPSVAPGATLKVIVTTCRVPAVYGVTVGESMKIPSSPVAPVDGLGFVSTSDPAGAPLPTATTGFDNIAGS
jgi:hypothetical protein